MSAKTLTRFGAALAAALMSAAGAHAASAPAPQKPRLPDAPLRQTPGSGMVVYPLRGAVYMITGAGANVTVSVGTDGVLVVDPGVAARSPALLSEIARLSDEPVRFVLDTSAEADHIGGNAAVAAAGQNLASGGRRPAVVDGGGGAPIWAADGVLNRLTEAGGEPVGWPTDVYIVAQKDMFVNDEAVSLLHQPKAHSDGDSFVLFHRSDVIAVGDIYTPDRYPVIDLEHGGGVNGLIAALNEIIRLAVPEFNEEGGTLIVPGHGRISDEADVAEYRDMVTIIRDRIQDMIKRKLTLDQVKAAKPSLEWDVRFGADKGAVFVEQIYKSLTASGQASKGKGA